jgi:photosystem II stability/assembly factor-like uncharacterized protein
VGFAVSYPHTIPLPGKNDSWTLRDGLLTVGAFALLVTITGALATRDQWATRIGAFSNIPIAIAQLNTMDYHSLAFDPRDPNVVYFGHHNGVMKSTDGGISWSPVLTQGDAMNLAIVDNALIMAGHEVFMRSEDGGKSWKFIATNLPDLDIHGFAVSPTNPRVFFAFIVKYGLWRSEDFGATWTLVSKELPDTVLGLAVVPTTPEWIYAATMDRALLKSEDGGKSWKTASGYPNKMAMALAQDPRDPRILYAASETGLFRSDSNASAWTRVGLTNKDLMTIGVSRANPSRVLVIDTQGRVYRSDDTGATWTGK